MALDSLLRGVVDKLGFIRAAVQLLVARGVSPNLLSLLSLLCAALAGIAFAISSGGSSSITFWLVLAAVFVTLNAVLDGLDGLVAREMGNASSKGDFLDHVIDRYADLLMIGGIVFGNYAPWQIGLLALVGVLLASYMGTQAQAVGIGRMYGGVLGRADRIALILGATVLTVLYPLPLPSAGPVSFPLLGWALVIFAVLGHATAVQRFVNTWRQL
ncbi:MAG TPA: CDP-alcohol phosphatidyltransferase family protein [Methanomicrobia archaeon]|nr:CDP-alcohol phosphatidyltransferase family protein [Methanomicrobia archaeon]